MASRRKETVKPIEVSIENIREDENQPRKYFDPEKMAELCASITESGILQPLVVRPDPKEEGKFKVVLGARRFRAARAVGLEKVPVIVRDDIEDPFMAQLDENLARSDLTPMEMAEAFQRAIDGGLNQNEIGGRYRRSGAWVWGYIQLLRLPPEMQEMVNKGEMKVSHALALLKRCKDHFEMREAYNKARRRSGGRVKGKTIETAARRVEDESALRERQKGLSAKDRLDPSTALSIGSVATNLHNMLADVVGKWGEKSPSLIEFRMRWQQISPRQQEALLKRLEEIENRRQVLGDLLRRAGLSKKS